RMQGLEFPWTF
nr:immunoglobulin light chain junction region [Macaca mulatta]